MKRSIFYFIPGILLFSFLIMAVISCKDKSSKESVEPAGKGEKSVEVVLMTTPFGTNMYNVGVAFEQIFKKTGSWVHIKHQETPGAMYMFRYIVENRDRMINGEVSHTITASSTAIVDFLAEGRPPFQKYPWPTNRTLISNDCLTGIWVTYDPGIKSLRDFSGRRVGTAERSRPFLGVLNQKPLFEGALGIYDRIKWAPLGNVGSKDAFLNGKIDCVQLSFGGRIEMARDGSYYFTKLIPSPVSMEILNSGKKLYYLEQKREWVKKGFDFSKDIRASSVLIKKRAFKELNRDIWTRGAFMCFMCDSGLPDDIVEEIVRVRHEYRKDFAKYHAALTFLPDTPYPIGSPKKYVHSGVIKAMKKLGYPIPE